MQKRWLINLILLLVVAALLAFIYLKPKTGAIENNDFEVSAFKLSEFSDIKIDFPAKAPVTFKKVVGFWRMQAPYDARADRASVFRILSIVAAKTKTKISPEAGQTSFSNNELEKYGLVNPSIKLTLARTDGSSESFLFGTFNPITEEQYIAHQNGIYLLPVNYSEAVSTQTIEMVDKAPLKPQDKVVAMDFSHLEQWQDNGLKLTQTKGQWQISIKEAKPDQNEIEEWLTYHWLQNVAESVDLYTPKNQTSYPYVVFTTAAGKKVRFDKLQESPKLLLAKPDEGLVFTFAADAGFAMLNPPINVPTE